MAGVVSQGTTTDPETAAGAEAGVQVAAEVVTRVVTTPVTTFTSLASDTKSTTGILKLLSENMAEFKKPPSCSTLTPGNLVALVS